jgi:hypothetical protein
MDSYPHPTNLSTEELVVVGLVYVHHPDPVVVYFSKLCREELFQRLPGDVGKDLNDVPLQ